LDYQIQAIQLNKIDEESVEYTETENEMSPEFNRESTIKPPFTEAKPTLAHQRESNLTVLPNTDSKFLERKLSEMSLRRAQTMQQQLS